MTEERLDLVQEHDRGHKETLESLKETDEAIAHAQKVLSEARIKLQKATQKYQERLHGPTITRSS